MLVSIINMTPFFTRENKSRKFSSDTLRNSKKKTVFQRLIFYALLCRVFARPPYLAAHSFIDSFLPSFFLSFIHPFTHSFIPFCLQLARSATPSAAQNATCGPSN